LPYLHHTYAEQEWAYDRQSAIGKLNRGLDEAAAKGWTVFDMDRDRRRVFAFEKKTNTENTLGCYGFANF